MDYKNAHVEIGNLVFVRVGVGCIGRAAVITSENEKGIADDWIYILKVKDKRISPFYLAFWLQTPTIQKEISLPLPDQSKLLWFKKMYLKMINEKKGEIWKKPPKI